MWLFDPMIAEQRKSYVIPVKLVKLEGLASAARRTAHVLTSQSPQKHPLDCTKQAEVEIQYTDNQSRIKRCLIPVEDLDMSNLRNGCDLLVISGKKKGLVVKHVKTIQENVKVRQEGKKDLITLSKHIVTPILFERHV